MSRYAHNLKPGATAGRAIIQSLCVAAGCDVECVAQRSQALPGLSRHRDYVDLRTACCAVLRERTSLSYPEIAALVFQNRRHASAHLAVKRFYDPVRGARARALAARVYPEMPERQGEGDGLSREMVGGR